MSSFLIDPDYPVYFERTALDSVVRIFQGVSWIVYDLVSDMIIESWANLDQRRTLVAAGRQIAIAIYSGQFPV